MVNFINECPARIAMVSKTNRNGKCYVCLLLLHINDNNYIPSQSRCEVFPAGCNSCLIREMLDEEKLKKVDELFFKKD